MTTTLLQVWCHVNRPCSRLPSARGRTGRDGDNVKLLVLVLRALVAGVARGRVRLRARCRRVVIEPLSHVT